MSGKAPSLVLNMSDMPTKRKLMSMIGKMTGLWEVSIKKRTLTRTLTQNGYYFVAVVTPFAEWIKEEWGDSDVSVEQAHEVLKEKILGKRKVGGIEIPRSTRTLDTKEFGEYVDKCAAWLAEFCGIVVVPSELFYEQSIAAERSKKDGNNEQRQWGKNRLPDTGRSADRAARR